MQVEHVTRERLAAGRATQQQRELAVRDRLLGKVVVHQQRVLGIGRAGREGLAALLAAPHEVLAHRAPRVGRDVLHRGRVGAARDDDGGVVHRPRVLERLDDARDGRFLLAHRDVDADHRVVGAPVLLLVDDRVDRDGRLARLAVADDQLTLAATDRDHRVDRLDARLHRLVHRLAVRDARRDDVHLLVRGRLQRRAVVDRAAQRVNDPSQHRLADGHLEQTSGALDQVAFLHREVVAVHDAAHGVLFEVHHLTHDRAVGGLEFHQLARHRGREPVDPGDTIAHLDHAAHLGDFELLGVLLDLLLNNARDLVGLDLHGSFLLVFRPSPQTVLVAGRSGSASATLQPLERVYPCVQPLHPTWVRVGPIRRPPGSKRRALRAGVNGSPPEPDYPAQQHEFR